MTPQQMLENAYKILAQQKFGGQSPSSSTPVYQNN